MEFMEIKREAGQSVVEYILLLSVVISLVLTFYNSQLFKRLFGNQGSIGKVIKEDTEFGYRHAFSKGHGRVPGALPPQYPASTHPSYYNYQDSETRFFGPKDAYP
jgi:hypothetical protein